jgi:hypothetical protein
MKRPVSVDYTTLSKGENGDVGILIKCECGGSFHAHPDAKTGTCLKCGVNLDWGLRK